MISSAMAALALEPTVGASGRAADARVAADLGLRILASHPDPVAQNQFQAVLTRPENAA